MSRLPIEAAIVIFTAVVVTHSWNIFGQNGVGGSPEEKLSSLYTTTAAFYLLPRYLYDKLHV